MRLNNSKLLEQSQTVSRDTHFRTVHEVASVLRKFDPEGVSTAEEWAADVLRRKNLVQYKYKTCRFVAYTKAKIIFRFRLKPQRKPYRKLRQIREDKMSHWSNTS